MGHAGRARSGRRLLQVVGATFIVIALAAPAAAEDPLEVLLEPIAGGPLDDLLPVDTDLIQVPFTNTVALQGETPVEAAIALSQATFESAATVLLTRDDLFADGMSSGAIQGVLDAPLLLTDREGLDPRVVEELSRLGAETVYMLGGTFALRPVVEETLEGLGYTAERVFGPTRVETAIAVAERFLPDATRAVVVRGWPSPTLADPTQAYADLLAVGGLAAEEQVPVFLTHTEALTDTVQAYLGTSAVRQARVIGGTAAVADTILQALRTLGIDARRVAGPNRAATAITVAEERGFDSSADADRIILAEGQRLHTWAPGFAAAAHAAQHEAPIVLALGPVVAPETLAFLSAGVVDNLLGESPMLVCAPFVDSLACAQAALALGQVPVGLEPILELVDDLLELGSELVGQVLNATGLTVSLCGLPAEEVPLDSEGRFAVPLPVTLPVGECDVEFTAVGANGLTYQGQVPVTLTVPLELSDELQDAVD
jgi:putative cell wall-binding protein